MDSNEKRNKAPETPTILILEEPCHSCGGRGNTGWERDQCVVCHGCGLRPTDAGDVVLVLVQHHFTALKNGRCG